MNFGKNVPQKVVKGCPPPPASPDELQCPVCLSTLSRHPTPKTDSVKGHGHEAAAIRNEIREMKSGKLRDIELVVAAPCGHIFHRFCLRHYCFIFQQANSSEKVECPVCMKELSMVKFHNIDYKAHLQGPSKFDKIYNETKYTRKELLDLRDQARQALDSVAQSISDATIKLDAYRGHQTSILDKEKLINNALKEQTNLRHHIEKCNQGINAMHKENLNIIKMYLSIMKDQPEDVLRDKRIPQPLIPYLSIILGDERLVKKFGEILKPVEINGVRSNTEFLIKEILADVGTKSINPRKLDNRRNILNPKGKPVVVKVQRSNVSIFSRTALDQESLQTILHQVKGPINKLHDTYQKLAVNQSKRNKKSILTNLGRSVSDIQVLFDSRKNEAADSGVILSSPQDSNADFLKPIPARRCRTTEPILMKALVKKPVMLKLSELNDQRLGIVNAFGDKKTAAALVAYTPDIKPEVNKELPCNVRLQVVSCGALSTKSCQTLSIEENGNEKGAINERISSKGSQPRRSSNIKAVEESHKVFQFRDSSSESRRRNSSAGFTPHVSGSVFEMLNEEDGDDADPDHNPVTSLVDDVSKITFATFKRVPCQNPGVDGDFHQPVIEYSVLPPKKVSTSTNASVKDSTNDQDNPTPKSNDLSEQYPHEEFDIESGFKESESHQNSGRGTGFRTMSGLLQGILPGPYLKPVSGRGQQEIAYMTEKVPIYQSKWLTKLPSTRIDYFQNNNNIPRRPPIRHARLGQPEYEFERDVENPPFDDACEEFGIQSPVKHTVIDIPSSNSITTRLPPITNGAYPQYRLPIVDRQIPRPISHTQFDSPMSQRTPYTRNISIITPENHMSIRQAQQTMSRYKLNSIQPKYLSDEYLPEEDYPPSAPQQYQGFGYNNDPTRGEGYWTPITGAPTSSGDYNSSGQIQLTLPVKDTLVELCRGLPPPPPTNRRTRSRAFLQDDCCYEYQNHFHGAVIRRNRDNSPRVKRKRPPISAMLVCPDGISPRMVRKARRKEHPFHV